MSRPDPSLDRGELAEVTGEMDTGIADEFEFEEDVDLREMVQLYNVEERESATRRQKEILSVVESLGGDRRAYGRERARKARAIIAELYSPPRISALARDLPQYGIAPGLALDLTTTNSRGEPWDFSKKAMRDEAEQLVDEQAPLLLVGTPMCTAFSTWQYINNAKRDPDVVAKELAAGRMHLAWMCRMYLKQIAAGRLFLHEHPANATSWNEPCVREVLRADGVARITADQCQLGQQTDAGEPLRKPTGFMANCPEILDRLHRRCTGRGGVCSRPQGGTHQLCNGKKARRAAIFQRELCEAVLIGLKTYLERTRKMKQHEQQCVGFCGIMVDADDDVRRYCRFDDDGYECKLIDENETCQNGNVTNFGYSGSGLGWAPLADDDSPVGTSDQDAIRHPTMSKSRGMTSAASSGAFGAFGAGRHNRFIDDLTGQALPEDLCRAARQTELDYFTSKEVWVVRKISEARQRTGRPPITVRWVETNKGDDKNPKIRSRLVAREIRQFGRGRYLRADPTIGIAENGAQPCGDPVPR